MRQRIIGLCVLLAGWGTPPTAPATENPQTEIERAKSLWDPEVMMEEACEGISTRYRLDSRQKAETCKMLTTRVTDFLDKHDKEFWPLLMELTELSMEGKEPDIDTAKRISQRGYHIFMDAKAKIMQGQDDFHKLLTAEQQEVHNKDLKGLTMQMDVIDRRFQDWQEGKIRGRNPLRNVSIGPTQNKILPDTPSDWSRRRIGHESMWEAYVSQFIRDYKLDESQKAVAKSILADVRGQAIAYRKSHSKELGDADEFVGLAQRAKPFDRTELENARRIQALLNKPFDDWFDELKTRLERIPTKAQRADYYTRFPFKRPPSEADDAEPVPPTAAPPAAADSEPAPPGAATTPAPAPAGPPAESRPKSTPEQPRSAGPEGRGVATPQDR